MKCEKCGVELQEGSDLNFCPECGSALNTAGDKPEAAAEEIAADTMEEAAVETTEETTVVEAVDTAVVETPAGKNGNGKKLVIAGVVAVAIAAVGAFALTRGLEKDPKQTVITAFENVFPEDQVYPVEEIFDWSGMNTFLSTSDSEGGMSLKLDDISEPSLAQAKTAGIRVEGKNDKTNKKSAFDMALTYGGMDFIGMQGYYGDETMMVAVPQLVNRVFTLDLSDGLVDRIRQSQFLAPMAAEAGMDLDALDQIMGDFKTQMDQESGEAAFDLKALYKRYQEGSKAQDDFKAALVVEKADKKEFTIDQKAQSCNGYDVTISKDAMMKFLRDSSDFFLNDEKLRSDYLKQLELTVKMSEVFGSGMYGGVMPGALETQQANYEDVKASVDEALTYLDKSLTDVTMKVYVDKKGRLAAFDLQTVIKSAEDETEAVDVTVNVELQGGAYLTQNLSAAVLLRPQDEERTESVELTVIKQGVSDEKQLTSDVMITVRSDDEDMMNLSYTGTYAKDSKDYHVAFSVLSQGSSIADVSIIGVVDELEKGKSFHATMDEFKVTVEDASTYVIMSGDLYCGPLTGEVTALEGTTMDIVAATEDDWQSVIMEAYFGLMGVVSQLGV